MDLSFAVHKLETISANTGKVHFIVSVHLLIYIIDNKTLGLNYCAYTNDAPLSDLLRQASINIYNYLMAFSDSSCKDCPDTGRSTGAYIIFYQCCPIDHVTHVLGPVAQSSAESEYSAACTAVML